MNNKYFIYGGLLLATTFTSCKEDTMFEESNNVNLQKYVTEGIVDNSDATRANVEKDGISFYWNDNDKITIWDGTKGYEFTSTKIEGTTGNSKWISQFSGEASLSDGTSVYGIYPANGENPLTFTLNDEKRNQTNGDPALSNTMYMVAQGTVSGNTVSSLRFKHLTSIFQFNIKNNKAEEVTIESVKVSAGTSVFPTVVTVADNNATYSETVNTVTLKMNNQKLTNAKSISGYLNFFPTPDLPKETELVFSAHLSDGTDVVFKQGKAGELYDAGSGFAKDGYKYVAGKRYSINGVIDIAENDPGYKLEDGVNIVYAAKGLKTLLANKETIGKNDTKIKLEHDINLENAEIEQIEEFKGEFDGNGKAISNYTLKANSETKHFGLFKSNSGTIKNLTIKNVTLNATVKDANDGASALVGINKQQGKVVNCSAEDINITLNEGKAGFGILVGNNSGNIEDVKITKSSLTTKVECNLGMGAGINNGSIKGTSTNGNITVNSYSGGGASSVGGLIGWAQQSSKIDGCSANVTIDCQMNTNSGGLIGANVGSVTLSCSNGEIKKSGSDNNGGGLIGNANGNSSYTGCYSTTTLYDGEGGFAGKCNTNCTFKTCFFTTGEKNPVTSQDVTKCNSTEELKKKCNDMNGSATESEYQFKENTGSDKDKCPLIIEKKTSNNK